MWPARMTIVSVLAACACAALFIWAPWADPAPEVGQTVPAQPAKEVQATPKLPAPAKTRVIYVYLPRVKADFSLPAKALGNVNQQVISTARVDGDERPHTVVTTLDLETGESESFVRADPLPILARETRGEAGISYGIKNGQPITRLAVRQNLIQIKAVRLGVTATLDQDGDWYAGAGLFYRW